MTRLPAAPLEPLAAPPSCEGHAAPRVGMTGADHAEPTVPDRSRLVLATDLDGTFLGGSATDRQRLYTFLNARRKQLTLIFVTGRDLPFVRALVADGQVPQPDYVIGDVGTTIAGGIDFTPLPALETHIAERWADAGPRVRALLDGEPGLRAQDTPFRYRQSYYYDPAQLAPGVLARIEAAGFDGLLSADTFLDVLPRGISKGPTLLHLVQQLGLPAHQVLTAGDTMNDLSLFRTGLTGVMVDNAEAPLKAVASALPNVYASPQPGAAGILDAIAHFRFL